MKKISLITLVAFIFLEISSLTSYFIPDDVWNDASSPLIVGVLILGVSVIFAVVSKVIENKKLAVVPMILNAFALGFCIESWYIFRGFHNPLWVMTLVSLAASAVLWLFYLFLFVPFINDHYKTYLFTFITMLIIAYIIIVFKTTTSYVSTFGFYLIMSGGFLLAISTDTHDTLTIIKRMSYSTFSVVVVLVILIVVLTLAKGDGDLDADFIGGGKNPEIDPPTIESPKQINSHRSHIIASDVAEDLTTDVLYFNAIDENCKLRKENEKLNKELENERGKSAEYEQK